jgi:hypothetical protein
MIMFCSFSIDRMLLLVERFAVISSLSATQRKMALIMHVKY